MKTIHKYNLGSSLNQRHFNKSKQQSSSNNCFRLNNPYSQSTERKVQYSVNNSIKNKTIININTERLATTTSFTKENKRSKMELKQYLNLIKQMNSKINKSINNQSSFSSSPSLNNKIGNDIWMRQHNQFHLKKRKVQPHIPYNEIATIVQKIYKHYDNIKRFGYSEDQITLIVRQICSKRKNIQTLLLNKKQKLKRSYFIYDVKKQQECIESIIKESLQNLNGKFDSIFRDLNNFSYFFQQQIIERGCNRIKEIKKSVINLKTQLQVNEYSEQLGFNQFVGRQLNEQKRREKSMKANFSIGRRSVMKYMSPINKNIDLELKLVEDQIGDYLEQNRNFVQTLGKISQTINR